MTTKIDFVNSAYKMGRISGLTRKPTPEEQETGLEILEDMTAGWKGANICTGYNFEESPDPNSVHNVPRKYALAFKSNLMMKLLTFFGKVATKELLDVADTSFSRMLSSLAVVPKLKHPSGMPVGSGNAGYLSFNKYYRNVEEAPISCATVKMAVGNIDDFYFDFSAYLDEGETIASYVMTSDDALTTSADSISDSRVIYTVTATGVSSTETSAVYQVKIVMTTSAGRIETRVRNFELTDIEID